MALYTQNGEIMQLITAVNENSNVRIDRFVQNLYKGLFYGTLQKAFRKRNIKVNGKRVNSEYIVMPGDKLEIFIADELLYGMENGGKTGPLKRFSIVYEDENIIVVNKDRGIPVHPDRGQSQQTLIDLVRKHLRERGQNPESSQFQPLLCHRLDRNTGGLVVIAKNAASHAIMLEKFEAREIKKYYQCLVKGRMERKEARLKAYLWKDAAKSRVFVNGQKSTGSHEIITVYKVLEYDPERDISRLEVELLTGRTHQIRAHLAYIGHPVVGDGKYGINAINRALGIKQQALWACRLKFINGKSGSLLDYLSGMEFSVEPGF